MKWNQWSQWNKWSFSTLKKSEKFWHSIYSGFLVVSGFVVLVSFQNCSKGLKVKVNDQASKLDNGDGVQSVKKCELDGKYLDDQESKYFYSSQTPPVGKTCDEIKGNRKCVGGQLTGLSAYRYNECTDVLENGTLVCNSDGVSASEGAFGVFYSEQFLNSDSECKDHEIRASCIRNQNNVASFSFADDNHFGSCKAGRACTDPKVAGKSYPHGAIVVFSKEQQPIVGGSCSSDNVHVQSRKCYNGVFQGDGSFVYSDPSNSQNPIGGCKNPEATACNKTNATGMGSIPENMTVTYFSIDHEGSAANQKCDNNKKTFTCKKGTLTDDNGNDVTASSLSPESSYKFENCVPQDQYCDNNTPSNDPRFSRWITGTSYNCASEVQTISCQSNRVPTDDMFDKDHRAKSCKALGEDTSKPKFIGAVESVIPSATQIKISGWACVNKDRHTTENDRVFDVVLRARNTDDSLIVMITIPSTDLKTRGDLLTSCQNYQAGATKAQFEFVINQGSDGIYTQLQSMMNQFVQVWVIGNNTGGGETNALLNHLECTTTSCVNKGINFYNYPAYVNPNTQKLAKCGSITVDGSGLNPGVNSSNITNACSDGSSLVANSMGYGSLVSGQMNSWVWQCGGSGYTTVACSAPLHKAVCNNAYTGDLTNTQTNKTGGCSSGYIRPLPPTNGNTDNWTCGESADDLNRHFEISDSCQRPSNNVVTTTTTLSNNTVKQDPTFTVSSVTQKISASSPKQLIYTVKIGATGYVDPNTSIKVSLMGNNITMIQQSVKFNYNNNEPDSIDFIINEASIFDPIGTGVPLHQLNGKIELKLDNGTVVGSPYGLPFPNIRPDIKDCKYYLESEIKRTFYWHNERLDEYGELDNGKLSSNVALYSNCQTDSPNRERYCYSEALETYYNNLTSHVKTIGYKDGHCFGKVP